MVWCHIHLCILYFLRVHGTAPPADGTLVGISRISRWTAALSLWVIFIQINICVFTLALLCPLTRRATEIEGVSTTTSTTSTSSTPTNTVSRPHSPPINCLITSSTAGARERWEMISSLNWTQLWETYFKINGLLYEASPNISADGAISAAS